MIGDRVLRPALVAVSRAAQKPARPNKPDNPTRVSALDRDVSRLDALDAGLRHIGPGFGERAWVSMPRQASSTT